MNTFIQQGHIKLLKSDNIYNDLYFKLILFFYKLIVYMFYLSYLSKKKNVSLF